MIENLDQEIAQVCLFMVGNIELYVGGCRRFGYASTLSRMHELF